MNATELITLANAHSIDLSLVAAHESDLHGLAARRRRTDRERRLGLEVIESAHGRDSRSYRRPAWSHVELGMAARKANGKPMPDLPWLAARYSFAGDTSAYWFLWYGLVFHAQRLACREGWRPLVLGLTPRDAKGKPIPGARGEPHFYLLELARLVLDEDAHRHIFALAPKLYPAYMGVEEDTWARILSPRLDQLRARYESWLNIARSMIQHWLNSDNLVVLP